jgi:nucleoside 2-deoxyribosyltransferase
MKFCLSIKYYSHHENRETIESICNVLEQNGHVVGDMDGDYEQWGEVKFSPQELMEQAFKIIDSCDVLLVEVSEKGVGIGIESGYAYAKGKPIFVIAKEGSDISGTLKGIAQKIIMYTSKEDMKLKLSSL